MKSKNFHWHMTGPSFRDYHLLLDEQAGQLFEITDAIADRARKIGGTTIHSVDEIARLQRLADNDSAGLGPLDMLEMWIDEAERRAWFLWETAGAPTQRPKTGGSVG